MNKVYHYVYKTIHTPTGRWYVGIRSCRCWPGDDPYLGSGLVLRRTIRKYGREEFSKLILVMVQTRKEAARIEAALIGPREVRNRLCLNVRTGGTGGRLVGSAEQARLEKVARANKRSEKIAAGVAATKRRWAQMTSRERSYWSQVLREHWRNTSPEARERRVRAAATAHNYRSPERSRKLRDARLRQLRDPEAEQRRVAATIVANKARSKR